MSLATYLEAFYPDNRVVDVTIPSFSYDAMSLILGNAKAFAEFVTAADKAGFGPDSLIEKNVGEFDPEPLQIVFARPYFTGPISIKADGVRVEVFMTFPLWVGAWSVDGPDLVADITVFEEMNCRFEQVSAERPGLFSRLKGSQNADAYRTVFGQSAKADLYIACRDGKVSAAAVSLADVTAAL